MDQNELNQARTNPEFLKFLDEKEKLALESKDIKELYEVLDTLLVLNLNEDRINKVYINILEIAFDQIEERLKENRLLNLEDDLHYIRSFYEHAIEKWSIDNFNGAKELFFILTQIINDKKLTDALKIHTLSCAKNITMDQFYEKKVNNQQDDNIDEKYGYFILNFSFDIDNYLKQNQSLWDQEYKKMEHLLK